MIVFCSLTHSLLLLVVLEVFLQTPATSNQHLV
jgi:hypothetical protein